MTPGLVYPGKQAVTETMDSERNPGLEELGWNMYFEDHMRPYAAQELVPARVARQDKGLYTILGESGRRTAEVSGRFRHEAVSSAQLPVVGDWVAVQAGGSGGTAIIIRPWASLIHISQ